MLKKLKALIIGLVKNTDGKDTPDFTEKLTECYAEKDVENFWQGDIYSKDSFNAALLPNPNIPYWMLVNRTCHLYQGEGRDMKLPNLNFIVVTPLVDYIKNIKSKDKKVSVKNAVSNLINNKLEGFQFIPANPEAGLEVHLVVNFNLIYSFSAADKPKPSEKIIQLSSPFCEHVFQRFSRFYYTVGYDDKNIKSKCYIASVVEECEKHI